METDGNRDGPRRPGIMTTSTSGNDPGHPAAQRDQVARTRADGARLRMDYTPPARQQAFRAAGRHTAQVKFLRRAIVVGTIGLSVVILATVVFNPFRHLPGSVSLAGVGIKGTTITMDSPKITGVQQGGGAYEIKARSGIQDITKPSLVELVGVDAKVGMADHTTTHILSKDGVFDNKADTMTLTGDVHIANTSGYVLNMKSALMKFREGIFVSHERLRVDITGGQVSADDMTISNNGHVILFRGNIASTFESGPDELAAAEPTP